MGGLHTAVRRIVGLNNSEAVVVLTIRRPQAVLGWWVVSRGPPRIGSNIICPSTRAILAQGLYMFDLNIKIWISGAWGTLPHDKRIFFSYLMPPRSPDLGKWDIRASP